MKGLLIMAFILLSWYSLLGQTDIDSTKISKVSQMDKPNRITTIDYLPYLAADLSHARKIGEKWFLGIGSSLGVSLGVVYSGSSDGKYGIGWNGPFAYTLVSLGAFTRYYLNSRFSFETGLRIGTGGENYLGDYLVVGGIYFYPMIRIFKSVHYGAHFFIGKWGEWKNNYHPFPSWNEAAIIPVIFKIDICKKYTKNELE